MSNGSPIRILFIEQFAVAGLFHYAHSLCQALAERGIEIALLTAADHELTNLPRFYRLLNRLPLWDLFAPGNYQRQGFTRRVVQVWKGFRYLWSLWLSLVTIWQEQPHIVHTSEMKFLVDLLLYVLPRRFHLVHTCHSVQRFSDSGQGAIVRTTKLWHCAQAWMYRRCDGVIFHAAENVGEFRRVYGFEPARWTVIPHGKYDLFLPKQELSTAEARQALGLAVEGHYVLFFGVIRRYKGPDTLLEAMAHLRHSLPEVRLVVAGAPSRDLNPEDLCAQARSLGIEENVIWNIGYVPQERVHLYFYACDVVAFPYRKVYDSGALKIAQALGRPVTVTDTGGLASAVQNGQAGIVVPPENPQAMAKALGTLLSDPALARSFAERGRKLANTTYSWDSVAKQTEQFYQEVLGASCAS